MAKQITVIMDDNLDKKLIMHQVKIIQQEQVSYSYSKVPNESLGQF